MADIFPGAKVIQAFGFSPRGTPNPAQAWSVIHTAASLASAEALALRHSTNPPPGTVSASFWVNRDGSVVQSMTDPRRQAPWTNGVWQNPDLTNPRIKYARLAGVNPNLRTLVSIENVSLEPGSPITAAQELANAKIVAWAHALIGMSVSRETVIGHYQITAIDRPNCPARNKSVLDRIVALATGDDVKLKGTPIEPLNNRQTSVTYPTGLGLTLDPTVIPYTNLHIMPQGSAFTVDWIVKGNSLLGSDRWYGGWVLTSPPQFGYLAAGGCGPLVPVEGQEALDAAAKDAADAVSSAAAAKAAEFQG